MNQLDKQYQELLFNIIENGVDKDTRNGKTRSVFGKQIRHKMSEGFPLLTTKKMYWKGIATELLWFLRGDTNIKFLVDNDCHIWDGDAYKAYENKYYKGEAFGYKKLNDSGYSPDLKLSQEEFINEIKTNTDFAMDWGDLGPIYGAQWRNLNSTKSKQRFFDKPIPYDRFVSNKDGIDQIANSINLLKTDPDSRRNRVNAWNVGELDQMVLPPCHTDFQFFTRELSQRERVKLLYQAWKNNGIEPEHEEVSTLWVEYINLMTKYNIPTRAISLMWNQRSVDTFLGLPFNIASYGLLLEIIAKAVNMVPDELIGNLGDVHLYEDHMSQAREQLVREPYSLPKLKIDDQYWVDNCGLDTHILSMLIEDFQIENYQSHPTIKAPLIN
jgi:thymidylate synthase